MKTLRTKYLSIALLFTIIVSSTGCETMNANRGKWVKAASGIGGAAIGALTGNAIGGKTGTLIGGLVGGVSGGVLGDWLAQYLDEREKEQAIEAAKEVLRNPNKKSAAWKSETNSGVQGTATAINTAQGDCRDIEMKVFQDGKRHKTIATFCKNPDTGEMEIV